jgi:hypothetical protein
MHDQEYRCANRISVQNLRVRCHFAGLVIDGKIILKFMSYKYDLKPWIGFN